MFTGLIQRVGTLSARHGVSGGVSLSVSHAPWDTPLRDGESVAVNGVCLTVTSAHADGFTADLLDETAARSNLGALRVGGRVNLERALCMGDRLGGHMVSGHIDGTGRVARVRPSGRDKVMRVACAPGLLGGMVEKGSVACDGISLTIAALRDDGFEAYLIPLTRRDTTLDEVREGQDVNIEVDMIGKYVRRVLERGTERAGVGLDDLTRAGFVT